MPAHQSTAAIGNRIKSDGRMLNSVDFRANRLVDKLALHITENNIKARQMEKLVKEVRKAAKAAMATLGQVTWAANNCKLTVTDDGNVRLKTCRGSTEVSTIRKKKDPEVTNPTQEATERSKAKDKENKDHLSENEIEALLKSFEKAKRQKRAKKNDQRSFAKNQRPRRNRC